MKMQQTTRREYQRRKGTSIGYKLLVVVFVSVMVISVYLLLDGLLLALRNPNMNLLEILVHSVVRHVFAYLYIITVALIDIISRIRG